MLDPVARENRFPPQHPESPLVQCVRPVKIVP